MIALLHSAPDQRFIIKLREFAKRGYAFDAGHALHKGTLQDSEAHGTQREAFDAYLKGFESGHRHGYLEIPTGVGKTVLFISLIKNYLDAVAERGDDSRTLIVVPSKKLAVQTAWSFAKFMPEIAKTIEVDDDEGKEIDWEHSQIGLQYSTAKHAHKKPKVLITTYQSLIRDRQNRVYPPQEYGMVIYDEGHNTTAECYGQPIAKFNHAIQLAVSATPEYSASKTVATRLKHRYYNISIADAINRGDLCNVRPVLLKTNFTIDKRKFQEFLLSRHGSTLSDAQMMQLLNEQTRNQTAMEAYMVGGDPDSRERYLGQTGMIFCGGIRHVHDLIEQWAKLLDKPKYQPVKKWLDEEGVELIAPMYGSMERESVGGKVSSGAWLKAGLIQNGKDRPQRGNQQFYTEDEIFDLHAKGKILLLATVKKLKEGYDAPRDSIIIDMIDRLSKVDATQIDGRGFRLNPPAPEFNDPGNPDKTCTVINMVDKNTYELYADDPHMLPIYCAEVIEGAEFRAPEKREHLIHRFRKHPPEIDTTLEESGFKLVTNLDEVREVSKKYKAAKKVKEDEKKPEDVWSSVDLTKAVGGEGNGIGNNIIYGLKDELEASKGDTVEYNGLKIPKEALVEYTARKGKAWGIKKEWGEKVAQVYLSGKKADDVLSSLDITREIAAKGRDINSQNNTIGLNIIRNIKALFADNDKPTAEYLGVEIPRYALVTYSANGQEATGLKREWAQKVIDQYVARTKSDEIWSSVDLGTATNRTQGSAIVIIKGLRDQLADPTKTHADFRGLKVPREAIVQYEDHGRIVYGLKKEWGEKIAEKYNQTSQKEGEWSSGDLGEAIGSRSAGGKLLAKLAAQSKAGAVEYNGITIPQDAFVSFIESGREVNGIKKEWGEKIAAAYKARGRKAGENLKSKPVEPRQSPADMTDEEREKKKRGGHDRGE